jgi:hypothetical protein
MARCAAVRSRRCTFREMTRARAPGIGCLGEDASRGSGLDVEAAEYLTGRVQPGAPER